ncbi:MAG: hypothetical protein KJ558_11250 [Gammaproteobacteria bacterium]|nr:hypothetical protein [Gammaproteobacteria bacterium]MBU1655383.1 hypothetical protein [Gammaproteobacteria bacterium]MBU1961836.1 hypothetical protein [Gammaproteobacteria bacterium]
MNTFITESTFARLVERACSVDRELRLELEREKTWDIYGEALATACDRSFNREERKGTPGIS